MSFVKMKSRHETYTRQQDHGSEIAEETLKTLL